MAAAMLVATAVAVLVAAVLGGVFMMIGARLAGIPNATFFKSAGAALSCAIVALVVSTVFSTVPGIGVLAGFALSVLLCLWIVKAIFSTTMRKALVAWLCNLAAQVVAAMVIYFVASLSF